MKLLHAEVYILTQSLMLLVLVLFHTVWLAGIETAYSCAKSGSTSDTNSIGQPLHAKV